MNTNIILDPDTLLEQAGALDLFPAAAVATIQANSTRAWSSIENDIKALGASPETLKKNECYLLLPILDDSSSISDAGAEGDVLQAANAFLEDYKQAKRQEQIRSDVLIAFATLNRGLIYPYTKIEEARPLTRADYQADGNTPLFDVALASNGIQMAKTAELALYGVSARTVTLFLTDGRDCGSSVSSDAVRNVVKRLVDNRNHIVGGVYKGDASRSTFEDMGIPTQWILDGGQSAAELINAFSRFSKLSRSALAAKGAAQDNGITVS